MREKGDVRWRIRSDRTDSRFIVLLALVNAGNDSIGQLVLLPPMRLPPAINVAANSNLLRMGRPVCPLDNFIEEVKGVTKS